MRHSLKEHRHSEAAEEPERIILLTTEGRQLVEDFEAIVSDGRRAALLDHVRAEREIDEEEYPNIDMTRAAGDLVEQDDRP
jgi:hypothetical protein